MPTEQSVTEARFLIQQWEFENAGAVVRKSLTDAQTHTLMHRIATAIDAARTVPPGFVREGTVDRKWCNRDEFVSGRVDYIITRPAIDNLITSATWTPETGYAPHTAAESAAGAEHAP